MWVGSDAGLRMPVMRPHRCPNRCPDRCIVLIVTAILGAGGIAQAQTGGARHGTEPAAGVSDRVDSGTGWGGGFELSDGGLARSGLPARDEAYVVIRDIFGSLTLGPEATAAPNAAHRMTVGSSGSGRPVSDPPTEPPSGPGATGSSTIRLATIGPA
jgi:hypothetical protein